MIFFSKLKQLITNRFNIIWYHRSYGWLSTRGDQLDFYSFYGKSPSIWSLSNERVRQWLVHDFFLSVIHKNSSLHGRHARELFNYHVTSFFMDLCQYGMTSQYPVRVHAQEISIIPYRKKSPVTGLSKVCFSLLVYVVIWRRTGVRLINVNVLGIYVGIFSFSDFHDGWEEFHILKASCLVNH